MGRSSGGTKVAAQPLERVPRVSVVIPCHNYGRYLAGSVGSVLAQDGVDLDVLIIDDGSTDDSLEVARRFAADDPRVTVRAHPHNVGHIPTFNEGMDAAAGEYLLLLSADDVAAPGALARAAALLDAHPQVGLAHGWARVFRTPEPPPVRGRLRGWTIWEGRRWMRRCFLTGDSAMRSPEVVVRTSLYRTIGGYREDLPRAADFEHWLRCAEVADVGRVDGIEQAFYRVHPTQMTATIHGGTVFRYESRRQVFEISAGRGVLPGPEALYRRACQRIAIKVLDETGLDVGASPGVDDKTAELKGFARCLDPRVRWRRQWWAMEVRSVIARHAPRLARLLRRARGARGALVYQWRIRTAR